MRLSNLFKISIAAVLVNKTRSILTSLGIIIGVASVIMLVSIGSGIRQYVTSAFEDMGTGLLMIMPGKMFGGDPTAVANKLTMKIAENLSRVKGAKRVMAVTTTNMTVRFRDESLVSQVIGAEIGFDEVTGYKVEKGRIYRQSEVDRGARVVIVGQTIVKELYNGNDALGQDIQIGDSRFEVIGVTEKKGSGVGGDMDNLVVMPLSTAMKNFDIERPNAIYAQSESTDAGDIELLKKRLETVLARDLDEDDYTVMSSQELLSTITGILSAITIALGGIAAISLVVGGIGIMNIMLVSVTERTHEIGLRKAVGAKPADILVQFLIEAIVLSLLGGIIGIILGSLGSLAINQFVQTSVTIWSVATAFGFSVAVGIIFGVWPAWKASKLAPIDALRYE